MNMIKRLSSKLHLYYCYNCQLTSTSLSYNFGNRSKIFNKQIRTISSSNLRAISTFTNDILSHLSDMKSRYEAISDQLANSNLNPTQIAKLSKEYSDLSRVVIFTAERESIIKNIEDLQQLEKENVNDKEMIELAKVERDDYEKQLINVEQDILTLLTPKDDDDDKDIVLEVRAGTGGDEASLFASEVYKMYNKYSLLMGWKWEELSVSKSDIGGFKEAQASIIGAGVYKYLKFESGVHRVQRIPCNDVKIQTSAASVIVMPQVTEIEVDLKPQDLRIDVFRAGGAGGQSVNKTESAVRITHIPTGLSISMQDERSQIQNRARAMKYLRARVYDLEKSKAMKARDELRSAAHGTGDRSDKIRTYNFPQDRVSDHRVNTSVAGVEEVLNGERLPILINALLDSEEKEKLSIFLKNLKLKTKTF
eukprot:gene11922-15954_t